MSKYIRTETGVFRLIHDVERHGDYYRNDWQYEVKDGIFVIIDKDELRKCRKSNRITDLCDEFVFHTHDGKEQHFLSEGHMQDVLSNRNINLREYLSCREIYGAIWTEWGLKYVAKINEKGELELL